MKRIKMLLLTAICMLSLAACGSKTPSLDEVEQAIEAGNVTMEDALEKGWVTQEWADAYIEERTVPASNKMTTNVVNAFTTTTISGEAFTQENLSGVIFFAFVDPATEDSKAYYDGLVSAYKGVKENGAEILLCTKSEDTTDLFSDAPFPVIVYNDSLKEAIKNSAEMIEGIGNIGSWYVEGAFLSAWYSNINAEEMPATAKSFVEIQQEITGGQSGGMAVME